MKRMEPGTELDGFVVQSLVHAGGMAHLYRVGYANGRPDPGFPMVMRSNLSSGWKVSTSAHE